MTEVVEPRREVVEVDAGGVHTVYVVEPVGAVHNDLDGLSDVVVTAPTDKQGLVFDGDTFQWVNKVLAHGDLSGLTEDQHPQYLTAARGDARYVPVTGGAVGGPVTVHGTAGDPAADLPYGYGSSNAPTGLVLGSSYPSDDVAGGTDGTGRLSLYSYQRANAYSFGETIRNFLMRSDAKAMQAWYVPTSLYDPVTREAVGTKWQPVIWTGAHYEANNHGSIHGHWEVEVPDSTGALQGRLEIPFVDQSKPNTIDTAKIGLDWTNIRTNLADFSVRAQNIVSGDYAGQNTALRIGGGNTINKDLLLSISSDMQNSGRRWILRANTDAEGGTADGTNFQLIRTDNGGGILGTALYVRRSDGNVAVGAAGAQSARLAVTWGTSGHHGISVTPSASPGAGAGYDAQMRAAADRAFQANVSGDANRRILIYADGKHEWGDGVGARDTNLYRSAAGTLKTDGTFAVGGSLTIGGTAAVTTSDARLADARTPTAHKASHAAGGSDVLSPADIGAVAKTGDTMTGALTLSGVPTANNHAAHKAYVDTQDGARLALTGGTMTGTLAVPDYNSVRVTGLANKSFSNNDVYLLAQAPFGPMWHDLLAFNRHYGAPLYETSADGTTFTTATRDDRLFSLKETQNIPVLNGTTTKAARWTWNGSQVTWSGVSWLVIGHAYVATAATKTVVVESSVDGVTWTTRHTSSGNWNQQPVWYALVSWGADAQVRVTITWTGGGGVQLTSMRMLTSRWGSQGAGREIEFPYDWDENRRMQVVDPVGSTDIAHKGYVDGTAKWARLRSGLWYSPEGSQTSTTLPLNELRAVPMFISRQVTVNAIGLGLRTTGAAGSTVRLGIYRDIADSVGGYPGALVPGSEVSLAADGAAGLLQAAINVSLAPGLYWLAAVPQTATATFEGLSGPNGYVGFQSIGGAITSRNNYSQPSVTGTLPAAFSTNVSSQGGAPQVQIKIA